METEVERIKEQSIMEVTDIKKLIFGDKEIDPYIVITEEEGKIAVYINKSKLYRTLNKKNDISSTLDVFLVDKIKEILKHLSEKEKAIEESIKSNGGKK
ncbi:MAG: hypothetical protein KJI69_05690 [Patescibacteria group bacterium]|nr:hypothetical protein [Patescibacteria group bacterium]